MQPVAPHTNAIWQQLMDWLQIQGRRPYETEQAVALAVDVKRTWIANGRRQIVSTSRLMPNITNELRRLRKVGGNDQALAQAFVTELGRKPEKKLRTHELYPGIIAGMRDASGLSKAEGP